MFHIACICAHDIGSSRQEKSTLRCKFCLKLRSLPLHFSPPFISLRSFGALCLSIGFGTHFAKGGRSPKRHLGNLGFEGGWL